MLCRTDLGFYQRANGLADSGCNPEFSQLYLQHRGVGVDLRGIDEAGSTGRCPYRETQDPQLGQSGLSKVMRLLGF
jgi:hypothetical protein